MTNNYGFDAVPVNPEDIFGPGEKNAVQPKPVTYEELVWEETALVKKARAFVEVRPARSGLFDWPHLSVPTQSVE
jgi:hypothetical protein